MGIIEVTLEESEVNARCERCQTTQWQCKHGFITTSTHYLRLCGWHYRKFKYRCPQHDTSLTKAWTICMQADLQTGCPQKASCEVYTFSKLIALHCTITKNYYKNSKEHIRIPCVHCMRCLQRLSELLHISMYAWHKRITSPCLHCLKFTYSRGKSYICCENHIMGLSLSSLSHYVKTAQEKKRLTTMTTST